MSGLGVRLRECLVVLAAGSASLGSQSALSRQFEHASLDLRFDCKKIGFADHASVAVVYMKLENGALAPAPCVLLVIWNHAMFLALRVNLGFDC